MLPAVLHTAHPAEMPLQVLWLLWLLSRRLHGLAPRRPRARPSKLKALPELVPLRVKGLPAPVTPVLHQRRPRAVGNQQVKPATAPRQLDVLQGLLMK